MTITQQKIDNLLSKVSVNLKKEDYEPQVKKQLKNLTKQVAIKGFRPGMVPVDMVKKMYGNSVLAEELNKLLHDEVYKYIDDNKLEIIASPIPAVDQKLDLDINSLKEIDFSYEIAHAPDVDLNHLKSSAYTKYKITVEDKMVDEEVLRIQKRFATYEYPEAVGDTDVLTFTVEELNIDGSIKEEGINTVTTLMVDLLKEDAKGKVLPLNKQDSFTYNVFDLMDRDRESVAKNILNMNDLSKLNETGNSFKLTLNNITRSVPAVINEEFFTKVYGEGGPTTEIEMRDRIKADLEAYFDGQTDSYLVNDIYKGLMEKADFPLPDEFLKRWIKATNEKPVTDQEIENDYAGFSKSLRWSLVQRKVVRDENIQITADEVKDRVRANMIQQLYGYGLKDVGAEWVEQFVQKQMADKKVIRQTEDQVLEDKVLNSIKTKLTLTEKSVSLDEFRSMIEKVS